MIHPSFMDHFESFNAARMRVATPEEVKAFHKKWFPQDEWPEWRKPDEWAEVSNKARRNRDLAEAATGRDWAPKMVSYALEPEARYEYMKTLAMFHEILFPHLRDSPRKLGSSLWRLSCNYCLITTCTEGGMDCPICGRAMVYSWCGD